MRLFKKKEVPTFELKVLVSQLIDLTDPSKKDPFCWYDYDSVYSLMMRIKSAIIKESKELDSALINLQDPSTAERHAASKQQIEEKRHELGRVLSLINQHIKIKKYLDHMNTAYNVSLFSPVVGCLAIVGLITAAVICLPSLFLWILIPAVLVTSIGFASAPFVAEEFYSHKVEKEIEKTDSLVGNDGEGEKQKDTQAIDMPELAERLKTVQLDRLGKLNNKFQQLRRDFYSLFPDCNNHYSPPSRGDIIARNNR